MRSAATPAALAASAEGSPAPTAHIVRARRSAGRAVAERAARRRSARWPATTSATAHPARTTALNRPSSRSSLLALALEDLAKLLDFPRRKPAFLEKRHHRRQQ